jgi:glutamate synthase domain-containing protein 3
MWARGGGNLVNHDLKKNGNSGPMVVTKDEVTIRADGRDSLGHPLDYHVLNQMIKDEMAAGRKLIRVEGVLGQRYIGATASREYLRIEVHGTPGNNLGALLNGTNIEVFGNGQDLTGNTMNSGRIIIHGSVSDVTGLAARGGEILIKDSAGYRTGIHMKEFKGSGPSIIIGGRVGDYLGEYMAGGTILVLGLEILDRPIIGQHIGAGMHGGRMYIMGDVRPQQLAPGASLKDVNLSDRKEIERLIVNFEDTFGVSVKVDWRKFNKIVPASSRPFGGYYDKTMI